MKKNESKQPYLWGNNLNVGKEAQRIPTSIYTWTRIPSKTYINVNSGFALKFFGGGEFKGGVAKSHYLLMKPIPLYKTFSC